MEREFTEFEIIDSMYSQPGFVEGLIAQIGKIVNSKVDFETNLVTFYGWNKNCSFDLRLIEKTLREKKEKLKAVSFR